MGRQDGAGQAVRARHSLGTSPCVRTQTSPPPTNEDSPVWRPHTPCRAAARCHLPAPRPPGGAGTGRWPPARGSAACLACAFRGQGGQGGGRRRRAAPGDTAGCKLRAGWHGLSTLLACGHCRRVPRGRGRAGGPHMSALWMWIRRSEQPRSSRSTVTLAPLSALTILMKSPPCASTEAWVGGQRLASQAAAHGVRCAGPPAPCQSRLPPSWWRPTGDSAAHQGLAHVPCRVGLPAVQPTTQTRQITRHPAVKRVPSCASA